MLTACADAFVSFLAKHPRIFDEDNLDVAEETFRSDGLSVTLSVPHPDDIVDLDAVGDLRFDLQDPARRSTIPEVSSMLGELLLQIEKSESSLPEGQRIDVDWLRRELGIDSGQTAPNFNK